MFEIAWAILVSVATTVTLLHVKLAPVYLIHAAENYSAHSSEGHTIGLQIWLICNASVVQPQFGSWVSLQLLQAIILYINYNTIASKAVTLATNCCIAVCWFWIVTCCSHTFCPIACM